MKKKVYYWLVFLVVIVFILYQYVYKNHRDIAAEEASFFISSGELYHSFEINDSLANAKYLDKTIVVKGKISNLDYSSKIVMIDEKLAARFTVKLSHQLKLEDSVVIKGRLIGFDDLLGEIQLDQCVIFNK